MKKQSDDFKRIKYLLGSFEYVHTWKGSKTKSEIKKNQVLLDAITNRLRMINLATNLLSKEIKKRYSSIIDFAYIESTFNENNLNSKERILDIIFTNVREYSFFFMRNALEYIYKKESGDLTFQNKNNLKEFISGYKSLEFFKSSIRTVAK